MLRTLIGRIAAIVSALLSLPSARPAETVADASIAETIGDRIVRFHADARSRSEALPSLALVSAPTVLGPAPDASRTRPTFAISGGTRVVRMTIERGTSLYGTGEVMGPLLRNGKVVTCWNTDAYNYGPATPSLYQSHPWVLAVRADGSAFGVLADTPARTVVDLRGKIEFRAQGPPFPVIVMERDSPQEVVTALADLTGHMPLPPRWALGYHQCRYSYYPDTEAVAIAREFRRRSIPCDAIWMDIDYMEGNRSFTFSRQGFPNPTRLADTLRARGFHSVCILDPGIKREPGYFVYDQGAKGDHWVKDASRADYTGRVWPGLCVFPDFTREPTRRWWAGLVGGFAAPTGVDGIWNDMNEPAVFDVQSKTMPENNWHRADPELGGPGIHSRYHNVYGMLMSRATREGLLAARPDRRPFVLTRASYLGGQRYAATWSGDNHATWTHFAASVPMALNLGLSGQPFSGPDIGGYAGPCEPELFTRWMGVGALLPFARGHTEKGNMRKEPWSFGPEVEATCRRAIATRYRLMPYLYGVFREAAETGLPVARPVFFADPKDSRLRDEGDAFLLGGDLLVVPQLGAERNRQPALPRGVWREVRLDVALRGGAPDPDLPRLYARGGSIIPLGPVGAFTGELPLETVDLLICLDADGKAEGTLYEDAGDGFGYRDGEYRITRLRASGADGQVKIDVVSSEGSFALPGTRAYRAIEVRDPGR